ncbi:peptidoglycan-binding protein [Streptomyces phyllanthi]|uniref:Peptidoglycan-binding protein n=2 Tax=Streptomyces phyllanthi TaxID=1803180 RepID=A0A5N8W6K0_9ACTN|nr:peptidoglycan-binding protein [Streptomyces phyllanthi]
MRRRRTEALAELLRELDEDRARAERQGGAATEPDAEYEAVPVPPAPERIIPRLEEPETEELPPVRSGEDFSAGAGRATRPGRRRGGTPRRGMDLRTPAVAVGVAAAALIGFGCALLLPGGDSEQEARPGTPPPTAAPTTPGAAPPTEQAVDPDGPGTLREGDSGPEVTELQERLRRIPNVYDNGPTSGTYDATLTEAVARFQLWYGIRGDETGVYGNDTRLDLESRTST